MARLARTNPPAPGRRRAAVAALACLCLAAAGLAPLPAAAGPVAVQTAGTGEVPWPKDAVDRAVLSELARSSGSLMQEGYPPPYFIGLRVSRIRTEGLGCAFGSAGGWSASARSALTADVRVGSRELDNHPLGPSTYMSLQDLPDPEPGSSAAEDVFALRHAIWAELDERYKAAAAGFLRKQALRVRRGKADYETDDMSAEEPMRVDGGVPGGGGFDRPAVERLCKAASAAFSAKPDLLGSNAGFSYESVANRLYDTEGAAVRYGHEVARATLDAWALTSDGMRVYASRSFYGRGLPDLPDQAGFEAEGRAMLEDLSALQAASSTSPFNAPALLDPSVAAAILQAFAARLSGEQQRNPEGAQTFKDKAGKLVLPSFLSLHDDPTLAQWPGPAGPRPLMGSYAFDEQGVPARRAALVDEGVLREYLLSRYPVVGFPRSNGHGRASVGRLPMGRTSNLILTSTASFSTDELLAMLRKECDRRGKPFGLWIRRARGWRSQDRTGQHQALRLLPTLVHLVEARTGKLTLVRDLDMVGTPLDLMGKILAVGRDAEPVDRVLDDSSGSVLGTTVTPTLLLAEVELQRSETKPEKPPVLPAPAPEPRR